MKSTLHLPLSTVTVVVFLSLLTTGAAYASEYQKCDIQYKVRLLRNAERHVDTGPYTKQFTACVRNLADCKARAPALARNRENAYRNPDVPNQPDLSSIRISRTHTSGHCSKLD